MSSDLTLHSGGQLVTLEDVLAVTTPDPTETHFPIPHDFLIQQIQSNLEGIGCTITKQEYGLAKDGQEMWGVMDLTNGYEYDDYGVSLGFRNAHNKRFSAALACGGKVWICDNLSYSADIVVFRKHTKHIMADLERLLFEALGKLTEATVAQHQRFENYKATQLSDVVVHDLLVRSVDAKVMANADLPKVLKEYRNPTHQEFEEQTAWALFNAYTQVGKGWNPFKLPKRTQRLHGLLDMVVEATESRMLVDDLVKGRAILPPVPPPFPTAEIVVGREAEFEKA